MLARKDQERRVRDPVHRRRRRVPVGDRRLRRPRAAGHDLSRALRRDLAARPADLRAGRGGRRDPASGRRTGSRRAAVAGGAGGARVAARVPGVHASRRVAQVQGLPGFRRQLREGARASGSSPAGAARTATRRCAASPTRTNGSATSRISPSSAIRGRRTCATTGTRTRTISSSPKSTRLFGTPPVQVILQLYSEPLQKFRLAGQRLYDGPQPPSLTDCAAAGDLFRPAAVLVRSARRRAPGPRFRRARARSIGEAYPFHAITQRPMMMYHSWDSQNAWLRQILSENFLYMNRGTAGTLGLRDLDWVWVESHHGRIRCQLKTMEGVEARYGLDLERGGQAARRVGAVDRRLRGDRRLPAQSPDLRVIAEERCATSVA